MPGLSLVMATTTFLSATRPMQIRSYLLIVLAAVAIASGMFSAQTAQAQSWKPLCANGGNTTGNHNSTWQQLNTTSSGGSTWKLVGGCIASSPPPPTTCANGATNFPTCTTFPGTCPDDHYVCAPWKPGFMKQYYYTYGPAPTCAVTQTYLGLVPDDGGSCEAGAGG